MRSIIKSICFLLALVCVVPAIAADMQNPKREFRGAWLHVIGQTQWQNKTPEQAKKYIDEQVQLLKDAGCNAVIFQVRPTADALYPSKLEPWSAWLTGKRGKAPEPMWDPLQYCLEQAHKNGMEFHAWLNPYRITSNEKDLLPSDHISNKEPHRFFKYRGQVLFDPAWQENRDFICAVVDDIVTRYDVDAIHIDDYFYPYPQKGLEIPDAASYAKFGNGMNRSDWRRKNVDILIEQMNNTIKNRKPWVRFGVSPFGIHRNKRTDPNGSNTSGLQNYDDLYADVLLWARNGWIDYLVPQLYWNLDHSAASTRELVQWWNDHVKGTDLYIGQDVKRTMDTPDARTGGKNELDTKVKFTRNLPNIKGNVWWCGYWVTGNYKGAADSLAMKYQSTIALPPAYGDKSIKPAEVKNIRVEKHDQVTKLSWQPDGIGAVEQSTDPIRYVVYKFYPGESHDINESQAILSLSPNQYIEIDPEEKGVTYGITALDRMNRESKPVFMTID